VDASEAPYFVDLVHEQLLQKLGDRDFNHEAAHLHSARPACNARPPKQSKWHEECRRAGRQLHRIASPVKRSCIRRSRWWRSIRTPDSACAGGAELRQLAIESRRCQTPHGSVFKPLFTGCVQHAIEAPFCRPAKNVLRHHMLNDEQTTYGAAIRVHGRNYKMSTTARSRPSTRLPTR